jgi:N-acetylglucosaminyldiphosphoundecaprenol N-acetyl-beta-D-mannosaminyltransferase
MREQNEITDSIAADRAIHPSLASESARANILGVGVDAIDMDGVLAAISRHLRSDRKGYVCAASVHGILESLRCPELAIAYAESTFNVPDGTPTVWVGRLQGFRQMDHVTGPALMREVFRRPEFSSCSHFFYGGRPGVAQELARRMVQQYPWTRVAGTYTPPFRDLNEQEERDLVAQIKALQPDILWVGISAPRQELWMHRMLTRLDTRLMFGVGAAFDFHTGRIRETPPWIKRAGFHWLHRLLQDPKRLWRRNLFNTAFLWHIALQLTGAREYPMRRSVLNTEGLTHDHKAGRTC